MSIKKMILESHMRSEKKIIHWIRVEKGRMDISKDRIKEVLDSMPKDIYKVGADPSKHYYHPIFTPFVGGFQVDLLQGSKKGRIPFFFVAINVNTRYAYAFKMKNKSSEELLRALEKLESAVEKVGQGKLVYITGDEERAWNGGGINQWLVDHKIRVKLFPSERHSALGMIDRFIRTLRDMNAKGERGEQGGRDLSPEMMKKLIGIYNRSLHAETGMTPEEMEDNPKEQKAYIIKKVYEENRREKITDYDLDVGDWVRFMIPRSMMKKRRYQVTPDVVKIVGKNGRAYVLKAADGREKTMDRWRLFPVDDPSKFTRLKSFE
jgi:hypothetical protein